MRTSNSGRARTCASIGVCCAALFFAPVGSRAQSVEPRPGQAAPGRKTTVKADSLRLFENMTNGRPFERVQSDIQERLLLLIAARLRRAAGLRDVDAPVAVVRLPGKPDYANALSLPGGEILIFEGMLELCDREAQVLAREAKVASLKNSDDSTRFAHHYSRMLAAVLAHEIGHYAGAHASGEQNRDAPQSADRSVRTLRNSRANEKEADLFALGLLDRSGYDRAYLIRFLKALNRLRQGRLNAGSNLNPYLESHPTAHARLADLLKWGSGEKTLHRRLADLEFAFAAVETGTDLEAAVAILKRELARAPRNRFLLVALARNYHRLWERSCRIDELLFKAAIVYSPFRDEMLTSRIRRPPRRICGNVGYYRAAVRGYRSALERPADPGLKSDLMSSFAVLLVYDPKTRSEAGRISAAALRSGKGAHLWNNHAIVLYFRDDVSGAERYFRAAAGLNDKRDRRRESLGEQRSRLLQELSGYNTGGSDAAALFNLGQYYYETGRSGRPDGAERARKVWGSYLSLVDDRSDWASFAANRIGIEIRPVRGGPRLRGVATGAAVDELKDAWGPPDRQIALAGDSERWTYGGRGVWLDFEGGVLRRIVALNSMAPAFSNGLRVGLTRAETTRLLGSDGFALSARRASYAGGSIIVIYGPDQDAVTEVLVME